MTGLVASTRAELLRLRRWPSLWVLLIVWVLLSVSFGYVFDWIAYRSGNA
jgi:ABC-2 type transport system permease protein